MTELEQLKAQRKEIDKRIKELTHPKYEVDGAKMYLKTYPTSRPDAWLITLEEVNDTSDKPWAYKQIVSAKTKDDAIAYLGKAIDTLTELYDLVSKGE